MCTLWERQILNVRSHEIDLFKRHENYLFALPTYVKISREFWLVKVARMRLQLVKVIRDISLNKKKFELVIVSLYCDVRKLKQVQLEPTACPRVSAYVFIISTERYNNANIYFNSSDVFVAMLTRISSREPSAFAISVNFRRHMSRSR